MDHSYDPLFSLANTWEAEEQYVPLFSSSLPPQNHDYNVGPSNDFGSSPKYYHFVEPPSVDLDTSFSQEFAGPSSWDNNLSDLAPFFELPGPQGTATTSNQPIGALDHTDSIFGDAAPPSPPNIGLTRAVSSKHRD